MVAVLPVVDRLVEDDSAPMDVFTVATRVIVRRTAYFINNSLLQHPMGFLAAKVVAAKEVWPYFRAHRGNLTLACRALRRHPDHYTSSIHPSFSPSISINTALRHRDIRVTHRPTRYLPGVRDPIVIKLQVLGPVPVT